jgi:hypothetical protein
MYSSLQWRLGTVRTRLSPLFRFCAVGPLTIFAKTFIVIFTMPRKKYIENDYSWVNVKLNPNILYQSGFFAHRIIMQEAGFLATDDAWNDPQGYAYVFHTPTEVVANFYAYACTGLIETQKLVNWITKLFPDRNKYIFRVNSERNWEPNAEVQFLRDDYAPSSQIGTYK